MYLLPPRPWDIQNGPRTEAGVTVRAAAVL